MVAVVNTGTGHNPQTFAISFCKTELMFSLTAMSKHGIAGPVYFTHSPDIISAHGSPTHTGGAGTTTSGHSGLQGSQF